MSAPNDPRGISLQPYDPTRAAQTAAVLGSAFETDPYMTSLLPPDHQPARLRKLYAASLIRSAGAPQVIDLAIDPSTGDILGAALWLPPGSAGGSMISSVKALPGLLGALGRKLRSTMAVFNAIERERPTAPHWYLFVIGVAPQAAGRGVGTALMELGVARADAHHQPAYLEGASQGHTGFYQRFGFQDLGPVDVDIPAPPVRMWRPER